MLAASKAEVLNISPKTIIETVLLSAAAILGITMFNQSDSMLEVLPVIGAVALAAQKALPHAQQLYSAWAHLKNCTPIASDALDLIENQSTKTHQQDTIPSSLFTRHIALEDASFKYKAGKTPVLNKANIKIIKGSTIGFKGTTGSGKSTLIDLLTGLISPSAGHLNVDGRIVTAESANAWYAQIAHVPQDIFLLDGTIAENIAFGLSNDEIDVSKIEQAAKSAQIHDFVSELPEGYNTYVGDRGVRLSGASASA